MKAGTIEARQKAGVVEEGAELINVGIGKMAGGFVDSSQKVDEVKGKTIGVSIDNLG